MTRTIKLSALLLTLIACGLTGISYGQEATPNEDSKKYAVTMVIGHTHVPKGVPSVTNGGPLIIPSWGLNFDFKLNEKWNIGIHSDMEIATYIIEEADGSNLERERPFIVSIVGVYKPYKGLALGLGFGNEFEKHHNFFVYRFGIEYIFELGEVWEIGPGITYDIKESTYDSWTIGLGVAMRF